MDKKEKDNKYSSRSGERGEPQLSSGGEERFLNPYNFVDVSGPTPRYSFKTNKNFHANSGYIDVKIKTVTPLFIPSPNENEINNDGDHKKMKFFLHNGQPLIPSTSLKGLIRSTVETLSNSCFPHDYSKHTILVKKRRGYYKYTIADLINKWGKSVCANEEKLCPACHMFGGVNISKKNTQEPPAGQAPFEKGSPTPPKTFNNQKLWEVQKPFLERVSGHRIAIGGKVSVSFGRCLNPMDNDFEDVILKPLGEPHPSFYQFYILDNRKGTNGIGNSKNYDSQDAKLGRKVYLKHDPTKLNYEDTLQTKSNSTVQLLNPGAVFQFRIDYFNLSHYELGLLLNSLNIEHEGQHLDYQLGMGKSLGLGRIKIENIEVTRIDRYKRYTLLTDDGKSTMSPHEMEKYINIFQRIQANAKENVFDPDKLNKTSIDNYSIKPVPGYSALTYIKEFTVLRRINDSIPLEYPIKYPTKKNMKNEMTGFKWFMDEKNYKDQRLFAPAMLSEGKRNNNIPLYNWGQESKKEKKK